MKKILSVVVLIGLLAFVGCTDDEPPVEKENVTFSLISENILNSLGNVEDSPNSDRLKFAVVTVIDANGEFVLNNKKIPLTVEADAYITESILLKQGEYKIVDFKILDADDNVTFLIPNEGSASANLVSDALPIAFEVSSETDVKPQVLNTIELITFKLGVYAFNSGSESFALSNAEVVITSGEDVLKEKSLSASIELLDIEKTNSYILSITKTGYITYFRTFTLSQLQAYADQALSVRLYEENTATDLAVYYPFSGNVNDQSGNMHHGVNMGATLSADQFGNFSSSYQFNGLNQFIDFGNILDDLEYPFTVSVWVKPGDHTGRPYNTIFTAQDNSPLYNGFEIHIRNGTQFGILMGDGQGENNGAFLRSKNADISNKTNVWTHLAAVVTNNNDIKLYVNGNEVIGDYGGSTTLPMNSNFPDDVARMGRWTSNSNTYYYTGEVDEFRVWKRALTQTQLKASM